MHFCIQEVIAVKNMLAVIWKLMSFFSRFESQSRFKKKKQTKL